MYYILDEIDIQTNIDKMAKRFLYDHPDIKLIKLIKFKIDREDDACQTCARR